MSGSPPLAALDVVGIAHDNKHPRHLEDISQSSDERPQKRLRTARPSHPTNR